MTTALTGQLVVAEKVDFDQELKCHTIVNIKNRIAVNTYPAVALVHVWIKLWLSTEPRHSVMLTVYNPEGETLIDHPIEHISNYRPAGMPPGVDMQRELRIIVTQPGIYPIVLRDSHKNVIAEYPLYIARAS
ncbi:hypothetical protein [Paenibacillus methanolicus]|uniref:Uncharacterized protein n=1 Tax=Paenibacillus methanolicus TaxID=582686 RepID=A0A5S5C1H0_9BACL|nr:hypothetical protein [Paenibacillus methanolicus]TYP73144.1 hypothetical protein BCM02_107128 [Paenibacillus methanolicus]